MKLGAGRCGPGSSSSDESLSESAAAAGADSAALAAPATSFYEVMLTSFYEIELEKVGGRRGPGASKPAYHNLQ